MSSTPTGGGVAERGAASRTRLTVRTRITVTAALLSTLALAGAGVLVYALESSRIESDVTAQVDQEVAELRAFQASAVDPDTGGPIDDPNRLLEVFLTRNVPDDDELLIWYAGDQLRESSQAAEEDSRDLRTRNRYGSEILELPAFQDAVAGLLARGGTRVLEDTPYGEVWVTAVPVQRGASTEVEGTLVIVNFLLDEHSELRRTMQTYAIVSLLSLGLLTLVAALQSGRLLAPLRALRTTAAEISTSDLTRRIPETGSGRDDVTALSRTFNGMLDRLESGFGDQRRFLDDAGHELKTPLTVLRGHLELLDPDDPAEVAETRDLLLDEVDRMARLVGDLILLAKSQRPDFLAPAPVDVGALTRAVHAKASALGARDWVVPEVADTVAVLDEQRVTQALLQLADNAVKHTEPGSRVEVGSRVVEHHVELWVRDEGRGVPAADRERIFDRFGRSVVPRGDEGFGLGLSIVRAIAEAHGGTAHVEDAVPRGARFVVRVPLVRPGDPPAPAREPADQAPSPRTVTSPAAPDAADDEPTRALPAVPAPDPEREDSPWPAS